MLCSPILVLTNLNDGSIHSLVARKKIIHTGNSKKYNRIHPYTRILVLVGRIIIIIKAYVGFYLHALIYVIFSVCLYPATSATSI